MVAERERRWRPGVRKELTLLCAFFGGPFALTAFELAEPLPADAVIKVRASTGLEAGAWQTVARRGGGGSWEGDAVVGQAPAADGKVRVLVELLAGGSAVEGVEFLRLRGLLVTE